MAIGKVGMSINDFYELTPVEFTKVLDYFHKEQATFFENHQVANFVGFGQAFSGKEFTSVFKNKKEVKTISISDEQKLKEYEEIKNRLGGGQ